MIEEISNVDTIIELILRDARARTKVDHSKAIMDVLCEIIIRCNEILNQLPFYEKEINQDD